MHAAPGLEIHAHAMGGRAQVVGRKDQADNNGTIGVILMTDNDRELIELAAKAAGHKVKGWINGRLIGWNAITGNEFTGWNPLESDGDAFRLMVALQISVTPCFGSTYIDAGGQLDFSHVHNDETAIAGTRRAIVMMAAEIGRGMK